MRRTLRNFFQGQPTIGLGRPRRIRNRFSTRLIVLVLMSHARLASATPRSTSYLRPRSDVGSRAGVATSCRPPPTTRIDSVRRLSVSPNCPHAGRPARLALHRQKLGDTIHVAMCYTGPSLQCRERRCLRHQTQNNFRMMYCSDRIRRHFGPAAYHPTLAANDNNFQSLQYPRLNFHEELLFHARSMRPK